MCTWSYVYVDKISLLQLGCISICASQLFMFAAFGHIVASYVLTVASWLLPCSGVIWVCLKIRYILSDGFLSLTQWHIIKKKTDAELARHVRSLHFEESISYWQIAWNSQNSLIEVKWTMPGELALGESNCSKFVLKEKPKILTAEK